MPRVPRKSPDRTRCAFTLVELLVVIGIIALLIAFLMPSLSGARQASQRVVCESKLRQMMIGAQMHLIDHKGYFPMIGVMPSLQPQGLNDDYSLKYDYFSFPLLDQTRMIAPITIGLATELSAKQARDVLSNINVGAAETDDRGFIRNFLCPSHATSTSEITQLGMFYITQIPVPGGSEAIWYTQAQSYIYNEAVMGYNDSLNRYRGQYTLIHQPGNTMFAADGLPGSIYQTRYPYPAPFGMYSLYNIAANPPITMADALTGNGAKAGDPENFDHFRHRGKINIAFCDDHVEIHDITLRDLAHIYLMAP